MICYKDMTFCTYYTSCLNPCDRALTEKVKDDAEKWMKNAPICMFSEEPDCLDKLENHIGETLEFEYKGKPDGDIITPALLNAAKLGWITNCKLIRNE